MLRTKLIITCAAVISLVFLWSYTEFNQNEVPFLTVTDLQFNKNKFEHKKFRIGGQVEENSISFSDDGLTVFFSLFDGERSINVEYRSAALPSLFEENANVLVEGKIKHKNQIIASNLMTKCASRYDEENIYKKEL